MFELKEYRLLYRCVFSIPEADDVFVITLTDEAEKRAITIVADKAVADELKAHERELDNHDHFMDAMTDVLFEDAKMLSDYRILIRGDRDRGYLATLVNGVTGKVRDLRVAEAVLFSVVSGCKMYTTLDVLQHFSTPFNKDVMSVAIPVLSLPSSLLQVALDKAIQEENYEGASYIRDEIKRREAKDEKHSR